MIAVRILLLAWVPASLWIATRVPGDWTWAFGASAGLAMLWAVSL